METISYKKKGQVQESVGAIIYLIVGVAIATLMLIFTSVLSGKVYSQTQGDLTAINTTDPAAYGNATNAIRSGFEALGTTGEYLPIIVLTIVIVIILGLILGLGFGVGGYGGGQQQGGIL